MENNKNGKIEPLQGDTSDKHPKRQKKIAKKKKVVRKIERKNDLI